MAFIIDTITNGNTITLFRLGRADFPDQSRVTTPWGDTRSVGEYEEHSNAIDLPCVDHVLRSELLRGFSAGRAKPTLGTAIARCLPKELVKRFEEAVDALINNSQYRFQPIGCHAAVELHPAWVQMRNHEGVVRIAVVGKTIRVGKDNINALIWKTSDALWSIGHVTPDN